MCFWKYWVYGCECNFTWKYCVHPETEEELENLTCHVVKYKPYVTEQVNIDPFYRAACCQRQIELFEQRLREKEDIYFHPENAILHNDWDMKQREPQYLGAKKELEDMKAKHGMGPGEGCYKKREDRKNDPNAKLPPPAATGRAGPRCP